MRSSRLKTARLRVGDLERELVVTLIVHTPVDRRIDKQMRIALNAWECDAELIAALLNGPVALETWHWTISAEEEYGQRYMVWPYVTWKRNGQDLRGHAVEGDEWTFPEDVGVSGTAKLWGMVDLPPAAVA